MDLILIILIIFILFEIPISFGMGLIFKKMKIDFKKGIIPFYNKIVLIKKYKLPQYHLILIFIPILGLYTNFIIYKKICDKYNKELMYVIELTLFPFVYNIFLGMELKEQESEEKIDNYLEDQKSIYEDDEPDEQKQEDEYVWQPKKLIRSNTIYKASKNNLSGNINLNLQNNNEIIDNSIKQKAKANTKKCPNCGAIVDENIEICYVCGKKING